MHILKHNPKGAGRKPGSTKDRAKINTTISRENAEWLRSMKERGFTISAMLDQLIEQARKEG
jgi:hypothetical protein